MEVREIPNVVLLLSPGPRHEGVSLVVGVCTTMADDGKSECLYFDHPLLAEDKGGVLPTPLYSVGARAEVAATMSA
jgi:hypothetical protein